MSRRFNPGSSPWVLVALLAAIAVLASLGGRVGRLADLRAATARRSLDSSAYGSRDLTRVLGRLGTVHSLPGLPDRLGSGDKSEFEARPFDQAFSLDELPPDQLGAVLGIDQEWIDRGVPTISLLLDPDDLTELKGNMMERGRDWERPAHFAWVEGGRVRFASKVGCRIHGGGARREGSRYGLRIYFRRTYGEDSLPAALFPTGGERPARRVVLRRDSGRGRGKGDWHFANAISHDIGRQIGLPTVHSQPAAVFVNGEFQEVRAVIERIDRQWLIGHYGHGNFSMARTKRMRHEPRGRARLGPPETYYAFRRWALDGATQGFEQIRDRVDVDNLVRWTLLVQMVGVIDFRQGAALLDLTTPDALWYWVPWDLNISLGIWRRGKLEPSKLNQIRPYYLSPRSWSKDSRLALVGRLLVTSDEFRAYFSTVLDEIYNHRLTREFIKELLESHRETAARFGLDTGFLRFVRRFLIQRPEVVRRQLQKDLGYGPTHSVQVVFPPGARARIDGFDYAVPYEGRYTEGSRMRLSLPEDTRASFVSWQIGEQRIDRPEVDIDIDRPLSIRLVTQDEDGELRTAP